MSDNIDDLKRQPRKPELLKVNVTMLPLHKGEKQADLSADLQMAAAPLVLSLEVETREPLLNFGRECMHLWRLIHGRRRRRLAGSTRPRFNPICPLRARERERAPLKAWLEQELEIQHGET